MLISATYPSKHFEVKGCGIAAKAIESLGDSTCHLIFVFFYPMRILNIWKTNLWS